MYNVNDDYNIFKFKMFVEDNPLFNLYNAIEPITYLKDYQYNWFKQTIQAKLNLICSSRQSGKTLFVITYAHFMSMINNKKVAIVTYQKNFNTPVLSKLITVINSSNPNSLLGANYDIILLDEFAYFSNQKEWLNRARQSAERVIAISSSNPGSVFNELCYKNLQRNPFGIWLPEVANNLIKFILDPFNKNKESINVVITKVLPKQPDTALEMLGKKFFDIEYNCSLL